MKGVEIEDGGAAGIARNVYRLSSECCYLYFALMRRSKILRDEGKSDKKHEGVSQIP